MKLLLSTFVAFFIFCLPLNAQNTTTGEGTGLLVSDVEGALPKGLWINQPRSEITFLLEMMPPSAPFRSLQEIKRNLMLSTYDTSLIQNDISIKTGQDLYTLRLLKLMQMGLWGDAFELYNKGDDPGQNDRLAEIGILLSLHKKGLAGACLDYNAYGNRFNSVFFKQIDIICGKELADENIISTQFPNSSVLKGLYNEPDYMFDANNAEAMKALTFLEIMMLLEKNKISYRNFQLKPETPPYLLKVFLEDKNFPSSEKPALIAFSRGQAILPLENGQNSPDDIQNLQQNDIILQVAHRVENNEEIPPSMLEKMAGNAAQNPENILYLQLFSEMYPDADIPVFTPAEIDRSLTSFPEKYAKEVNILKRWLDKSSEFSNNPAKVYEKQVRQAPDGNYSVISDDWTNWLGNATENQFSGLSLLIVLNNNKNIGVRSESMINDLRYVGLIEQAHQIGRDMTVNLMRSNK